MNGSRRSLRKSPNSLHRNGADRAGINAGAAFGAGGSIDFGGVVQGDGTDGTTVHAGSTTGAGAGINDGWHENSLVWVDWLFTGSIPWARALRDLVS